MQDIIYDHTGTDSVYTSAARSDRILVHARRKASLCACLVMLAAATPETPQQARDPKPIVRVTTRMVQVGVLVHDAQGQPVRGLTSEDFTILDNGKPQEVAFLSEAGAGGLSNIEPGTSNLDARAGVPQRSFTNLLGQRADAPASLTVLLLDGLNTGWEDIDSARREFASFIATQVQPQDRIAVFTLGRELRVVHNFSNDTDALIRAMAGLSESRPAGTGLEGNSLSPALVAATAVPPDVTAGGSSGVVAEFEQFLQRSSEEQRVAVIQRRAEQTFNAIEAIGKYIRRVPGRKNLVWVSAGFPLVLTPDSSRRFSDATERAVRAINEANIALYPVDARGLPGFFDLTVSADPQISSLAAFGRARRQQMDRQAFLVNSSVGSTMRDLAEKTGGRAFLNSNDIKSSIRAAIDDAQAGYTLGFYPSHDKWNGAYHQLKVSIRRKHVRVRHRLGYFAFPDTAPKQDERQASLRAALASPIDATDLGLTVLLAPESPENKLVRLEVRLRAREIRFAETNGLYTAAFDLVVAQRDAEGRSLTAQSSRIDLRVKRETHEGFLRDGVSVGAEVERVTGARSLKIVVSDADGPAIGSLAIPLSQPAS